MRPGCRAVSELRRIYGLGFGGVLFLYVCVYRILQGFERFQERLQLSLGPKVSSLSRCDPILGAQLPFGELRRSDALEV